MQLTNTLPAIRKQSIHDVHRVDSPMTNEYKIWKQTQLQQAANLSDMKANGISSYKYVDIPDTFAANS